MYFDSQHYARVEAFSPNVKLRKTRKATYVNRTDQKNYHILRHIFERMRDTCGVFDGHRGQVNYTSVGKPKNMPWGAPESQWDVHVVEWQKELIRDGSITAEDVLSPGSIYKFVRLTVTRQNATHTFRTATVAMGRRAAVNAYWLLTADLIKIEEANFGTCNNADIVTPEPIEDVIE